jgi:hypothetical protein
MWVSVTTAWGVRGFRMEYGIQIRRVPANILNKQSRQPVRGFLQLGFGRGANNASL